MGGGVFLRRGEGLVEMVEQRYELEDHLQELIERFPNLLAGIRSTLTRLAAG